MRTLSAWNKWRAWERAPTIRCPILQAPPEPADLVRASDGFYYSLEMLREWCVRNEVPRSPVTGEALRPYALLAPTRGVDALLARDVKAWGGAKVPKPRAVVLFEPRPPNALRKTPVMKGSAPLGAWTSRAGVALRMHLDWSADMTLEWRAPRDDGDDPPRLLTPPPARELVPIFRWVAKLLRITRAVANPEHIGTSFMRTSKDAPWRTLEELVLEAASESSMMDD